MNTYVVVWDFINKFCLFVPARVVETFLHNNTSCVKIGACTAWEWEKEFL